jgi:salicylate synthetase
MLHSLHLDPQPLHDEAAFNRLTRRVAAVAKRHAAGADFHLYFEPQRARIGIGCRDRFEFNQPAKSAVKQDPFYAASRWCRNQLHAETVSAFGFVSFDVAGQYHAYRSDSAVPLIRLQQPLLEIVLTPGQIAFRGDIPSSELCRELLAAVDDDDHAFAPLQPSPQVIVLEDREHYRDRVRDLVQELIDGKLDKAILSRRVATPAAVNWLDTFQRGMACNQFYRSYLFDHGALKATGFTPEILLQSHGSNISTNPLAGTRRRGRDAQDEARMIRELRRDPKEIKEHAISVLLAQEELLRVCTSDSVVTQEFMALKQYRSVQHLSSRVNGVLKPERDLWDAMRELFPGVTVSGIGKSEAIAAIGRYEAQARGLYAGCIGIIDGAGNADFSLSIRSLFEVNGQAFWQAGAGIVPESDCNLEFKETCHKLAVMSEITSFA